jgi:hypothetical protein
MMEFIQAIFAQYKDYLQHRPNFLELEGYVSLHVGILTWSQQAANVRAMRSVSAGHLRTKLPASATSRMMYLEGAETTSPRSYVLPCCISKFRGHVSNLSQSPSSQLQS